MKRTLFAVLLFAALSPLASAGVIRHVVRPVVKHTARATAKVLATTARVTKAIIY
jgi:hypothetical protein